MICAYQTASRPFIANTWLFLRTIFWGAMAMLFGYFLFPTQLGIFAVFMTAFSMMGAFDWVMEKNRTGIWEQELDPKTVNYQSVLSLMAIFMGAFFVFLFLTLYLDAGDVREIFLEQLSGTVTQIYDLSFPDGQSIFIHNIVIMLGFFIFALIFRDGVLFVLLWNASVWAIVFGMTAQNLGSTLQSLFLESYAVFAVAIFPHMVTKAMAYILAALSGYFLSSGIHKYHGHGKKFFQVLNACIWFFVLGLFFLAIAAILESQFAPYLLQLFFR